MEKLENRLKIDTDKFKEANYKITLNMQELKDKIARARHAAEGVSSRISIYIS